MAPKPEDLPAKAVLLQELAVMVSDPSEAELALKTAERLKERAAEQLKQEADRPPSIAACR